MLNYFDIVSYVKVASSYAADIDFLVVLIAVLVLVPFVIAEILLIGFVLKFRKKEGTKAAYITGEDPKHKKWISIPHYIILAFDVIIIIFAVRVWVDVKQDLPKADRVIAVEGRQWAWNFNHPGPDGELGTNDDIRATNKLHVEVDKVYHFKLTSIDVMHDFSVPVFRLKQDAIPGREITGWFKATKTGEHDIQCAEMCGIGHGLMSARIVIQNAKDHDAWLRANSKGTVAAK
jgi:cytochrome c oxidase subunit 2